MKNDTNPTQNCAYNKYNLDSMLETMFMLQPQCKCDKCLFASILLTQNHHFDGRAS